MTDQVRVWAPNASKMDILVGGRRIAGARDGHGWWRGPVLRPGDDYAFSVDDGPPRPDPRSRWQPDGVHGRSRWIGDDALRTLTPSPFQPAALRDAVIYERAGHAPRK
jgi:maltooligosyltrehalose trehalohydrolase